jgi:hypothetical protein
MKRIVLGIIALMFCLSFVGCNAGGGDASPTATATPVATPIPTPVVTIAPTPVVTPTPTLGNISYTTGLQYEGDYKPVLVVIENSPAARPQTGLQTADVVYEVPVEGSITRFVCVFSDNVPEGVMPVRSGRVSFLYIQQEWNAIFMHFGGSGSGMSAPPSYTFYGNALHDDLRIDVDGLKGKWNDYYYRVKGIDAPHNVMGNPLLAQQLYDYSPEPLNWQFDSSITYSGSDVTQINLPMCSNDEDYVSYTYDPAQDAYLRFMNGKKFVSAETDSQVAVKNVIVQYSTYESIDGYKVWQLTGSGDADIYIGGKLIKGTWEKASATAPTIFRDADGKQIVLHPGNTWIHIHPEQ